jgi:hypothetical protein
MPRGEHNKDNTFRQVHGGEAALVALRDGKPFSSLAHQTFLAVLDEMGIDLDSLPGLDRVALRRFARVEAAARLFDMAAMGAAEAGDLDKWERYMKRSGWLSGKVLTAVKDIRAALAADPGIIDAALAAVRDRKDE